MAAAKLNDKQRQFVREYTVDFNGKQAAIRAGYAKKSAEVTASRLLRNAKVQAELQRAIDARAERTEITADRVLEEIARLGFSNMLDYLHIPEDGDPYVHLGAMTREQASAVQEVTVEDFKDGRGEDARDVRRIRFKLADKKASLELLGKHLRLFGSDAGGVNVNVNVDARREEEREERFGRLYDQLDAYRTGHDDGHRAGRGGVPVDPGGADDPAAEVP